MSDSLLEYVYEKYIALKERFHKKNRVCRLVTL